MNVLVIGESCEDIFIYGTCERICPEAPVPVFKPEYEERNKGMAANVVANIKALDNDINISFFTNEDMPVKTRIIDKKSNQMLLRVDSNDVVKPFDDLINLGIKHFDCIVISDYDKGFLTRKDITHISAMSSLVFLDTKKELDDFMEDVTFIKVNEGEYLNSKRYADKNKRKVIITKSGNGATYNDIDYKADKVEKVFDVSGAGDTFLAALVVEYLKEKNIINAIKFANKTAGIVVQKRGVTTP